MVFFFLFFNLLNVYLTNEIIVYDLIELNKSVIGSSGYSTYNRKRGKISTLLPCVGLTLQSRAFHIMYSSTVKSGVIYTDFDTHDGEIFCF